MILVEHVSETACDISVASLISKRLQNEVGSNFQCFYKRRRKVNYNLKCGS